MNFDIENELRETLSKDEKLLWTGRPKSGIAFRPSDLYLIPFSLMWCGFAVFWESTAIASPAPLFFRLWGIPFIVIGLYMVAGRFFADAIKRKNTVYGITDNRVIIKSGIINKNIKSLNIRTISDLTFTEKNDGSGTITLCPADFRNSRFNGMSSWPGSKLPPGLEFIEDVKKVYGILIEQQRKY